MIKTPTMVVSMRLPRAAGKRLRTIADRHGWTVSDASARLVEEGLRRAEFAFVDFRDSPVGRQAYMQGSSLAVWEVATLANQYENNLSRVASHLGWVEVKVKAAINYAAVFPDEIQTAIEENESMDASTLARSLPQLEEIKTKAR